MRSPDWNLKLVVHRSKDNAVKHLHWRSSHGRDLATRFLLPPDVELATVMAGPKAGLDLDEVYLEAVLL
jgi:hypothetical protein